MPSEPVRQPATGTARGGGRGGRGRGRGRGRGKGRGGGNSSFAVAAAAAASAAAAAAAVGAAATAASKQKLNGGDQDAARVKDLADIRFQAAVDRQRHLEANFHQVVDLVKPALAELCGRSVQGLLQRPDAHLDHEVVRHMSDQLGQKFDKVVAVHEAQNSYNMQLAHDFLQAKTQIAQDEFENRLDDLYDQYYDGLLNKLRLLSSLHAKELPFDLRDDRFEYRVIDDDHFDCDFGKWDELIDGNLVSEAEGARRLNTAARAKSPAAAAAATTTADKEPAAKGKAVVKGKAPASAKRKAQAQPGGLPTPKKATRNATRNAQLLPPAELSAPQPAKGLLAAAKEAAASTEVNTPAPEDSNPTSPEPATPVNDEEIPQEQMSPKPPKNATDADEYGLRSYVHRKTGGPPGEKILHYRFMMPRPVFFEPHEIGFRDSTNDPSRQARGKPKLNKYTWSPNSSHVHVDHRMVNYDYATMTPDDFDQDLVRKHALHPRHGLFLSSSRNESEEAGPYVMPGKPVVYIANPSGRVAHASRSFLPTTTQRSAEEAPLRSQMVASVRRFCKTSAVDHEDIAITEYVESDEQLLARSLGTAERELQASSFLSASADEEEEGGGEEEEEEEQQQQQQQQQQQHQPDPDQATIAADEADEADEAVILDAVEQGQQGQRDQQDPQDQQDQQNRDQDQDLQLLQQPADGDRSMLSFLAYATAFDEAKEATRHAPSASNASQYDAIRDVFTSTRPKPAPVPDDDILGLNLLAQICTLKPRMQESDAATSQLPPLMQDQSGPLPAVEPSQYPDSALQQHPSQPHPQQQLPPQAPLPHSAVQGQNAFYPGYAMQDHRDPHMAAGRPVDPAYNPRGMPGYANEAPPPPPPHPHPHPPASQTYGGHVFWPQQGIGPYPPPLPATSTAHPRMPFSHNASAEPLPPLRPPRSRNHSLVLDEPMHEARMRTNMNAGVNAYYGPPPPRGYSRAYSEQPLPPPPHPAVQPSGADRVLPAPHQQQQKQQQQGYLASSSPPSTYGSQPFGNLGPLGGGQMVQQSPPGTPQAASASTLHQRPAADATNGKYRKLQPAPVPAHRAWSNKPELRTIFWDHKETGSSAALPNSGPTQIRGWNDRGAPSVRFAVPPRPAKRQRTGGSLTLPPLREVTRHPRPGQPMVTAPVPTGPGVSLESMAMYGFGAIPTIGSALPLNEGAAATGHQQQQTGQGACIVVATPEPESEQSIKKRLRPRKGK
ncbi:hypothetical protein L249_3006 [Ophiocordyceps polyrhachis-furcata BCC 54312]|uniref:Uncharacterized protein n=1 Tax=Ophiocordyceps polyrhachis-furcata BCC 54312 TaxID=1330021 RepID=A0A367LN78_9HYPO|nr:hypothetical protein L249_3006 [Ophiocordyceps polyrhachis-furcata BCC 54312]